MIHQITSLPFLLHQVRDDLNNTYVVIMKLEDDLDVDHLGVMLHQPLLGHLLDTVVPQGTLEPTKRDEAIKEAPESCDMPLGLHVSPNHNWFSLPP